MSTKQCSLCGSEYDARIEFCFRDGKKLGGDEQHLESSSENSTTQDGKIDAFGIGELEDNINFGSIGDLLDIKGSSVKSSTSLDFLAAEEQDEDSGFFHIDDIDDFEDEETQDSVVSQISADLLATETYEQVAEPLNLDEEKSDPNFDPAQTFDLEEFNSAEMEDAFNNADTLDMNFPNDAPNDGLFTDDFLVQSDSKEETSGMSESLVQDNPYFIEDSPSKKGLIFAVMAVVGLVLTLGVLDIVTSDDSKEAKTELSNSKTEKPQQPPVKNSVPTKAANVMATPAVSKENVQVNAGDNASAPEQPTPPAEEPSSVKEDDGKEGPPKESKEPKETSEGAGKSTTPPSVPESSVKTTPKPTPEKVSQPKSPPKVASAPPKESGGGSLWGGETECSVTVKSNVPNATVLINQQKKGKANSKIVLDCGSYSLKLVADGYQPREKKIDLKLENMPAEYDLDLSK